MDPRARQTCQGTVYQGYTNDYLRNRERNFLHRTQSLDFKNGFRAGRCANPQEAFIVDDPKLDTDQLGDLVKLGCLNPEYYHLPPERAVRRTLGDEKLLLHQRNAEAPSVLRFYAYHIDSLPQEKPFLTENWRLRKYILYFYVADGTIRIWENRESNSGFTQGINLRRRRFTMPGKDSQYYNWYNMDVGIDVDLAGHQFHIYDCDEYTRLYFESQGGSLKPSEAIPDDPYFKWRDFINRPTKTPKEPTEFLLAKFIKLDGIVLAFEVVVDESFFPAGDVRKMALRYYVFDDTIELCQIAQKNTGYDPASAVIRRQKVPKNFHADIVRQIGDKTKAENYTFKDLRIGDTLLLFGKKTTVCDCDEYTRKWYREKGIDQPVKIDPDTIMPPKTQMVPRGIKEWDPLALQGGYEDSLQNCLHLTPYPPRSNILQKLFYQQEVLRYEAKLVTQDPAEQPRRFMICYYVGDETVMIMELKVPSIHSVQYKFLSRRKLAKEGDVNPPRYYTEKDFILGSIHHIEGRYFQIIDCDQHVINFARDHPETLPLGEIEQFQRTRDEKQNATPFTQLRTEVSDLDGKVKQALLKLLRWHTIEPGLLYRLFLQMDEQKSSVLSFDMLKHICAELNITDEDEVLLGMLQRASHGQACSVEFPRFMHTVMMSPRENVQSTFIC